MRRLLQAGLFVVAMFAAVATAAAAPLFVLYGGPGTAAGIRIEGAGHADPYDPDGYPSQLVLAADNDNPYLFSGYNRSNGGLTKLWIASNGNTYSYSNPGSEYIGGTGAALFGAANIYTGYSASLLSNEGKIGAFADAGMDVRNVANSDYAPLKAQSVTASGLSGAGNAYACIDSNGQLFRSVTPCVP